LTPIVLCLIAAVSGLGRLSPLFVYGMALVLGYMGRGSGWETGSRTGKSAFALVCPMCWICSSSASKPD